ncbi:hypothetical protein ILUMI_19131 [Ignelater luminosus]|uniref:Uncharacterized protein n=1 Tax=Ignelater luminosus TaxID=2038154 RepID=A0A8K0CKS2_IGNLU|nr:hypothetical protein ILUMI_19131 [Ignelater luminosus]
MYDPSKDDVVIEKWVQRVDKLSERYKWDNDAIMSSDVSWTVSTEEHRHTGQYVAEQIEAVFTDIGINKFIACCTDNAANMKKAWDLFLEKYADKPISFYGYAAHTLNLLVNDITKLNTTDILINSAKAIIKVIKSKSVLTSAFFNLQREKQEPRKCVLKFPVATRWASIKWITVLESDECRINEVTEALIEIEKVFKKELPLSDLSSTEQDKILEAVQARRKMCLKPIHFSANILHPKLKGKHLSAGEIVQGLQYIHSLARHLSNVDENNVLENLADFRSNSGFWETQFVQDSAINPNISPVTFRKGICTEFPLRFVAEAVLTMPATSAATERSFSSYGNIHTKKRNRLSVKRAGMLTYVNHNLKLFSATADKIKIVTNNDKSLNFFGYKANDELPRDSIDTSESTVTLGLGTGF